MCNRPSSRRCVRIPSCGRRGFFTGFLLTCALLIASTAKTYEFEPISLVVGPVIQPGEPLACQVALTGQPNEIHIYSSPPGIVSYNGPVAGPQATVYAQSAPVAPSGPVTVYLTVDGNTTVAAEAVVE